MEERTDAVTIQTLAAIKPDDIGVSIKTQKVAIGAGQVISVLRSRTTREHIDIVPHLCVSTSSNHELRQHVRLPRVPVHHR